MILYEKICEPRGLKIHNNGIMSPRTRFYVFDLFNIFTASLATICTTMLNFAQLMATFWPHQECTLNIQKTYFSEKGVQ